MARTRTPRQAGAAFARLELACAQGRIVVSLDAANEAALANHPRKAEIKAAYDAEVAAFRSGEKTMVTVFTGPISDNTGKVQIAGAPDIGKLYDDNGMWFASNVVGSTKP